MSISSESEPPYDAFHDEREEVSEGSSGEAKGPSTARRRPPPGGGGGLLSSLLAPFEGCCFSERRPARRLGSATVSGPLSEFIIQASAVSERDESSSSEEEDVALGATAKTYVTGADKKAKKEDMAAVKERLDATGIALKDLVNAEGLDAMARWRINLSLTEALDLESYKLESSQCRMAALAWCNNVTLSQRTTHRLLEKLVLVATQEFSVGSTIESALNKHDEFSTMELSKTVETRLIEEIMGELYVAAEAAEKSNVFLIISNVRTVAVLCRKQGDLFLSTVFDTGMTRTRGPAFLGFTRRDLLCASVGDVENYVIKLYTEDPLVRKSPNKFTAWTLLSKQQLGGLGKEAALKKGVAVGEQPVVALWDAEAADVGPEADPRHYAKVAYGAMYRATEAPPEEEHVFSRTAGGAVNVRQQSRTSR